MINPLIQYYQKRLQNRLRHLTHSSLLMLLGVGIPLLGLLHSIGYSYLSTISDLSLPQGWNFILVSFLIFIGIFNILIYEILFQLSEYTILLPLPVPLSKLYDYLLFLIGALSLGFILVFMILYAPLLYLGNGFLFVILVLSLFLLLMASTHLTLFFNLVAGRMNRQPKWEKFKQVLVQGLPSSQAFSMYASPLSYASLFILAYALLYAYFTNWGVFLVGIALYPIVWYGMYRINRKLFRQQFIPNLLFTKDTSLKYRMRHRLDDETPAFGNTFQKILPRSHQPHFEKERQQLHRRHPYFFYLPLIIVSGTFLLGMFLGFSQWNMAVSAVEVMTLFLFIKIGWDLCNPPLEFASLAKWFYRMSYAQSTPTLMVTGKWLTLVLVDGILSIGLFLMGWLIAGLDPTWILWVVGGMMFRWIVLFILIQQILMLRAR